MIHLNYDLLQTTHDILNRSVRCFIFMEQMDLEVQISEPSVQNQALIVSIENLKRKSFGIS
jgi:hypothetical protein